MKTINHFIVGATIGALALAGCSREPKFKIEGSVQGAADRTLVLEKSDFHGTWVVVDSMRTSSSGAFKFSAPSPASPEIYRLSLGDRFIYFPVDSIETVTLTTSADDFGAKFELSGTDNATKMAQFEQELLALQSPDSAAMAKFKRDVYTKYIKDGQGSILGYYVLTKFYGDKPLYDPANHDDAKYYAAVATQFDHYRPNDPHGNMVKQVSLQAMRSRNSAQGKKTVVQAQELKVLDIDLPDEDGKNVRLSDVVGKGKPVVVIFSLMNEPESPAFNRELNRIYTKHSGAVEFYQVSFDTGHYEWRDAARNLPWITVIDPAGNASTAILDYNLGGLPAVFLYDAAGDLVDRPASLQDLDKKL